MMKHAIFSLLLLLTGLNALSADVGVLKLVRQKYNASATIDAAFEIKTWWAVREKETVRPGTMKIAAGNRFRLVSGSETMVSDGKTYWQFNSKNNQVIIRNLSDIDSTMLPSQILTRYLTSFPFKEKGRSNGLAVLVWKADSSADEYYTGVSVWAATNTGLIKKAALDDRNGNKHTYTFSKMVVGSKLSKEVFTFAIPKGAEVVDNR